jgi:hypothetical protein
VQRIFGAGSFPSLVVALKPRMLRETTILGAFGLAFEIAGVLAT